MQRPIEQNRMNVARTDVPDIGERMVRDSHRIAFIEPHVSVEGAGEQKRKAHEQEQDVKRLRLHEGKQTACDQCFVAVFPPITTWISGVCGADEKASSPCAS